jgi:hypothetical protein
MEQACQPGRRDVSEVADDRLEVWVAGTGQLPPPPIIADHFSRVVGVPISTNAETAKVIDEASSDGLFTLAQTGGMVRRQDRRDSRQDCRQPEGAIGADKRSCKQGRCQQRVP